MSIEKSHIYEFDGIIKRIMEIKNFKFEYEVADLLGFKRVAFSERKKRNSVPVAEIELFCHKESINTNWVLKGEGEICRERAQEVKADHAAYFSTLDKRAIIMKDLLDEIAGLSKAEFYQALSRFHGIVEEIKKKKTESAKASNYD